MAVRLSPSAPLFLKTIYPTHANCSTKCSRQFCFLMISLLLNLNFATKGVCRGVRVFPMRLYNTNFRRRDYHQLNCSHDENPSPSSMENEQDAFLKAISELSKAEGRVGKATIMVLGGTFTNHSTYESLSVNNKMSNMYPAARGFTAIGSGGDDFVQSMVVAVESVIQHPIPQGRVKQKLSSGGKYVSVNIGPVQILSSNQVQAIYYAMKRDDQMRYFL